MQNIGASPIDPQTNAGRLRLIVNDTQSQPLEPDQPGFADYSVWSDAQLEVAWASAQGNDLRAAGHLYLQLAAEYAARGKSIKTDDLAIDTRGRGKDLREVAQSYLSEADAADVQSAADYFQIVPFAGRRRRECAVRPEGTPRPLI